MNKIEVLEELKDPCKTTPEAFKAAIEWMAEGNPNLNKEVNNYENIIYVDLITFPENINDKNPKDYLMGHCKCETPFNYAICIPRKKDKEKYTWYCPFCGTRGTIYSNIF